MLYSQYFSQWVLLDNSEWIFGINKPNIFINAMNYYLLLLCTIFFTLAHIAIFYLAFLIIASHIVLISILGLLNRSL